MPVPAMLFFARTDTNYLTKRTPTFRSTGGKALTGLLVWLVASVAVAQETEPETYVDVPVPRLTDWNDVNALTVIEDTAETTAVIRHTRQSEAVLGRTYIYPDQAT